MSNLMPRATNNGGPREEGVGASAERIDEYDDEFLDVCGNIGCDDGWVADCFDGLCMNAEDGCELCLRRCDWCNRQPTGGNS